MVRLTSRLSSLAGYIKQGERVIDVGTDHGLLPIYLIQNNITNKVILADINEGPLEKAKGNLGNSIDGWDSVLSILQMPAGVPVATVALDGAKNAALLALRILGASDENLRNRLAAYQDEMRQSVLDKADALKNEYPCDYR